MKVEYAEETSVRKSLAFEIEAEVVDREIAARAQHYARRVKMPGFRPGKIPAEVIRQHELSDATSLDKALALGLKAQLEDGRAPGCPPEVG